MGLEDVSKYPALFAALLGTGTWSLDDLKKVAGLNFLRVFREVEKVGPFFVKSLFSSMLHSSMKTVQEFYRPVSGEIQ